MALGVESVSVANRALVGNFRQSDIDEGKKWGKHQSIAMAEAQMPEQFAFTVRADCGEFTTTYAMRDYRFLQGELLPEATPFLIAIGNRDNYTVARGMDTKAWTHKPVRPIIETATALLAHLTRDRELFSYDYQYSFSEQAPGQKNSGAQTGFAAFDHHCCVDAKSPGQLYLRLLFRVDDGTPVKGKIVDIRSERNVQTTWGPLHVHRRSKPIAWLDKLPPLISFLESTGAADVDIRHHRAVETAT
ncbi:MAG: hypothetical protein IT367_10105 [Candidatus Hydrogenedentes bacterium]|nr:hypothetical protein [Candidatus Hydrogenedentota bacterium]